LPYRWDRHAPGRTPMQLRPFPVGRSATQRPYVKRRRR
jgi:hypothetical protein